MARRSKWEMRRLRNEREMDARLLDELGRMGADVARVVMRFARHGVNEDGEREFVVPNQRQARENLRNAIWSEVVKPYFVGRGEDALKGAEPQSPYTRLIVEGIRAAVGIVAEEQVAMVKKGAASDPVVVDWLTRRRPRRWAEMQPPLAPPNMGGNTVPYPLRVVREQGGGGRDRELWYDPFHLFVDPNGYRLSDNVWRTSIDVRRNIDKVLDYHIPQGMSAVDIADILEQYLKPGAAKWRTRKPYGVNGSYAARRLSRTEITAAAGRSFLNASLINPYVEGVKWNLSASHPKIDICDDNASGGTNGDGVYAVEDVPQYPGHPHCLCYLTAEVVQNLAEVTAQLRAEIDAQTDWAMEMEGAFDLAWLIEALLFGWFVADMVR